MDHQSTGGSYRRTKPVGRTVALLHTSDEWYERTERATALAEYHRSEGDIAKQRKFVQIARRYLEHARAVHQIEEHERVQLWTRMLRRREARRATERRANPLKLQRTPVVARGRQRCLRTRRVVRTSSGAPPGDEPPAPPCELRHRRGAA